MSEEPRKSFKKLIPQIQEKGTLELKKSREKKKDSVTGVNVRKVFDTKLELLFKRNRESDKEPTFSIMLMDLDKFKETNDNYGHVVGDSVLKTVGNVLNEIFQRKEDTVAKYGGDELVVIIENTGLEQATTLMFKVNERLKEQKIKVGEEKYVPIKISSAVVQYSGEETPEDLLSKVDKLMYEEKETKKPTKNEE